jgi:hypothetical protein
LWDEKTVMVIRWLHRRTSLTSWWAEDRHEICCATPTNNRLVTHSKPLLGRFFKPSFSWQHLKTSPKHISQSQGILSKKLLDSINMQLRDLPLHAFLRPCHVHKNKPKRFSSWVTHLQITHGWNPCLLIYEPNSWWLRVRSLYAKLGDADQRSSTFRILRPHGNFVKNRSHTIVKTKLIFCHTVYFYSCVYLMEVLENLKIVVILMFYWHNYGI